VQHCVAVGAYRNEVVDRVNTVLSAQRREWHDVVNGEGDPCLQGSCMGRSLKAPPDNAVLKSILALHLKSRVDRDGPSSSATVKRSC
jgi:hypothetical protein